MHISINTYVLADDSTATLLTGPRGFHVTGANQEHPVALLRAEGMRFYDRGNRTTTLQFSVTRRHSTARDAEYFILAHDRDVPRHGLLTLTARSTGGAEVSLYIAGAMVTPQSTYLGITTQHTYQIRGGILLAERPAGA